ncbi:MAG: hypothetical protein H8D96_15215 [Desulfobacterales bacterium]|uniref:Uncharacterized protein n=1 Tax=Candidatus Desulfatibia vada TaxID=2841696 RepID=A0A8J6NVG0_9BACT|nr:hypothetical protein [Candidatus Desulfatibia vada]MBL6971625.1 hypothetical protein [Desulfobacterales bacterium]
MKKFFSLLLGLSVLLISLSPVIAAGPPKPFGLALDQALYNDVLNLLEQRAWGYEEFEKKGDAPVKKNSPQAGRNTFLRVKPREKEGLRTLYLFFNDKMILEAVIAGLEPRVLPDVKAELNRKYNLVKDSLMGEDSSVSYAYALWQQASFYIELQKLSPHYVRLMYVNQTYYENYREIFHKTLGTFRPRIKLVPWLNEL